MRIACDWVRERLHRIPAPEKYGFLSTIAFGVLTHLFVFSNSLIYHDSAVLEMSNPDATFTSGRWGLGVLSELSGLVGITSHSAAFDGLVSLVFIALACMVVVRLLEVKTTLAAVIIGCLMVSFPSVAGTFSFMFTAAYYFFALPLSLLALELVVGKTSALRFIVGALLIAFSIGIYQAYLSVVLAVGFGAVLLRFVYGNDLRRVLGAGAKVLGVIVAGALCYLLINKALIAVLGVQVTSYQGMDSAGSLDLGALPHAVLDCYKTFLKMKWDSALYVDGINNSLFMRVLLLVLSAAAFVTLLVDTKRRRKEWRYVALVVFFVAVAPLAMNSIAVMSTDDDYVVHTLMMYSLVFYLVLLVCVFERTAVFLNVRKQSIGALMSGAVAFCLTLFPLSYCYLDNIAYYRMSLVQSEMDSWFTVLVSEIKGCEGYSDDLPVAFIGSPGIEDATVYSYPTSGVGIVGFAYDVRTLTAAYDWTYNMRIHTGFSPMIENDVGALEGSDEVKEMPCYPDDGSIRVVDGVVVVKFSELD